MRIAYVTETWPPEINGVSLTVARTVAFLRERGHAVDVTRPRQPSDADLAPDGNTLLVPGLPIPGYPGMRFGLPVHSRLVERWQRFVPDLVHVATEGPLGWSAISAAQLLEIPITSDFRTRFDQYGRHYGWIGCAGLIRAYLRGFHNRTHLTCVPTQVMRDELLNLGIRQVAVHGRGVDTRLFGPHRRDRMLRRLWRAHGPVALYVGRLAPEKNLGLAIRAYEAMRLVEPTTRFVVVGDGPWRERLRTRCPEAILCGTLTGEALAAHYASADVFLFPSLTETFGNVTVEAMASGLSVVAYDSGAAQVLMRDGDNGRLVKRDDEHAFLRAAADMAADADARDRLGAAARDTALALDWDTVLARFESALTDVASGTYSAVRPASAVLSASRNTTVVAE
ncbi:MAG TPA: glycosyltransferase family 1 protein [Burkholderiaceae bacterium]|nr:glycosyltransferase family 1 protein [Burkholderiaceae bacterium]